MKQPPKLKGNNGFTLLEVIVTFLIMGIMTAGVLGGLSMVMDMAKKSSDWTAATEAAQSKMEELLNTPWNNLQDGHDVVAPYARFWTVDELSGGCRLLTVNVDWTDYRGRDYELSLKSTAANQSPSSVGLDLGNLMQP